MSTTPRYIRMLPITGINIGLALAGIVVKLAAGDPFGALGWLVATLAWFYVLDLYGEERDRAESQKNRPISTDFEHNSRP